MIDTLFKLKPKHWVVWSGKQPVKRIKVKHSSIENQ